MTEKTRCIGRATGSATHAFLPEKDPCLFASKRPMPFYQSRCHMYSGMLLNARSALPMKSLIRALLSVLAR